MAAPPLPWVIGHRGAAGTAPENTLASFRKAAALGARWVEFDVRLSADGRCILLHDDTVERTTDGKGRADRMMLEDLAALDAGGWFGGEYAGEAIPTLEETIDLLGELGLGANVEIKPGPGLEAVTGAAVARVVASSWPAQLPPPLLSSFKPASLDAARDAEPDLARGLLVGALPPDWQAQASALQCVTIHCDHRKLRRTQAREVRAAGFPLLAYTVNEAARAKELMGWGVSSVISDNPERMLAGISLAPVDEPR